MYQCVIPVEVQRSQAAAKSHWWEVSLQGLLKVYLQLDSCTFTETALKFQVLQLFRTDQAPVIRESLLLTVAQRGYFLALTEVASV